MGPSAPASRRVEDVESRVAAFLAGVPASALVPDARDLAGTDLAGHPWAKFLIGAALTETDPTDTGAVALISDATDELREGGDGTVELAACCAEARRLIAVGDIDAALAVYHRAEEEIDPSADCALQLKRALSLALFQSGDVVGATRLMRGIYGSANERGDISAQLNALSFLVYFSYVRGNFRGAEQLAGEALQLERDTGTGDPALVFVHGCLGAIHALRGDWSGADDEFEAAFSRPDAIPAYDMWAKATWLGIYAPRDDDRAGKIAAEIEEALTGFGSLAIAGALRLGLAAHAGASADVQSAEQLAAGALDGLAGTPLEGRAHLLLGEALLEAGESERAAEALGRAAELFGAFHADYWVARSYVRLAEALPAESERWLSAAAAVSDGDPAYRLLQTPRTPMRVKLLGVPGVFVAGERVEFPTRHAELVVYALTLAGDDGVPVNELGRHLWPCGPPERLRARLRTTLWQVRTSLGGEAWRIRRRSRVLMIDLVGVEVDVALAHAVADEAPDSRAGREAAGLLGGPVLRGWEDEPWLLSYADRFPLLGAAPRSGVDRRMPLAGSRG